MSEISKTLSIVGAGLVLLIAGIIVQPRPVAPTTAEAEIGKPLFKKFEDPNSAASMEVVSFNEQLGKKRDFKVQRTNDRWVLPSHNNYPADARDQLINAAISLSKLEIQKIETNDISKQDQYGVIDPTTAKAGSLGTGKLVVIKNSADETLANVIIGKEPRDIRTNEAQPGLRYVRVQNQDPIYLVKLASDKFSTRFEDWIETNLLKMNNFDLAELNLQDYVFDAQGQQRLRSLIHLLFDDKKSEWSLKRLRAIVDNDLKEIPLASDEELNTIKLNDLKTALADLKIVNVEKKPESLVKALSGQKGSGLNQLDQRQLMERGFYLIELPEGGVVLQSKDGEARCSLKDGIQYILRFGDFEQKLNTDEEKPADPTAAKGPKINRYIMVEARFDPKAIPLPTYLPVPDEKPAAAGETAPTSEKKTDDKAGKGDADKAGSDKGGNSGKAAPANSKSGTSMKNEAEQNFHLAAFQPAKADPAKTGAKTDTGKAAAGKENTKSNAKDAVKSNSKAASDPDAKSSAKSDSKDGKAAAKSEDAPKAEPKSEPATPDEADAEIKELERKRAIQENERLKADYDKKIKEGESKARQLNNRFAEWYYVISDEVYKKIHLSKDDIIQKKKPAGDAPNGANPFGGLKGLPPGLGQ